MKSERHTLPSCFTAAAAAVRPAEAARTRKAEAARRTAAVLLGDVREGECEFTSVKKQKKRMWPRTFEELVHCCIFLPVPGDRAPWEF